MRDWDRKWGKLQGGHRERERDLVGLVRINAEERVILCVFRILFSAGGFLCFLLIVLGGVNETRRRPGDGAVALTNMSLKFVLLRYRPSCAWELLG